MRIYNSLGEPMDFCADCMPDEAEAEEKYSNMDWYEYDTEHPDYEEWDDYTCEECGCKLTRKDD